MAQELRSRNCDLGLRTHELFQEQSFSSHKDAKATARLRVGKQSPEEVALCQTHWVAMVQHSSLDFGPQI